MSLNLLYNYCNIEFTWSSHVLPLSGEYAHAIYGNFYK